MLSERLNMYLPYFENLKSDLRNNDSVLNIDTVAINDINLTYGKDNLFSKKNKKLLTDPLDDNPITVQVLGIFRH